MFAFVSPRTPPSTTPTDAPLPTFDPARVATTARAIAELADRTPGEPTARTAARRVAGLFKTIRYAPETVAFRGERADGRVVRMHNVVAVSPGSDEAILVLAHRDTRGLGPGLDDNATGTATLIELARGIAGLGHTRTFVFASVDGGTVGQVGARYLAQHPVGSATPIAVIAVDAIGGTADAIPMRLRGDFRTSTELGLVGAARRAFDGTRGAGGFANGSFLRGVADLVIPRRETGAQAPFVDLGIPAIQLGDGGDQVGLTTISEQRLGSRGLAILSLLRTLDEATPAGGVRAASVPLGVRFLYSWAIALVTIALLVPPAIVTVTYAAAARHQRLPYRALTADVVRAALPLVGLVLGTIAAGRLGLAPTAPWRGTVDLGVGALLLAGGGTAAGIAAAVLAPVEPLQRDPVEIAGAGSTVCAAAAIAGTLLAVAGSGAAALMLVPVVHLLAFAPRIPRLVLVPLLTTALVAPWVVVLAYQHIGPVELVAAIADGRLPAATALGTAPVVAAVAVASLALLGRRLFAPHAAASWRRVLARRI